jgi:hypothetical protein
MCLFQGNTEYLAALMAHLGAILRFRAFSFFRVEQNPGIPQVLADNTPIAVKRAHIRFFIRPALVVTVKPAPKVKEAANPRPKRGSRKEEICTHVSFFIAHVLNSIRHCSTDQQGQIDTD